MASDFLKKMAAQAAQNVDRQYGTGEKVYGSSLFLKNMAAKSQAAQKPPVSSSPKLDPAQQTKLQLATLGMQQPTQNDIDRLYQKRNELKALQLNPYNDQNIGNVASEITSIDKQIESLGKIVPGAQLKQSGIRAYTEPLAAGVQDFTSGIYSALEAGANALDSVIPENILSKGIHKLYKADQAGQQTTEQKLQEAQVGRGDAFKAYQTLGQGVGQAAPNAVLALATGGASVATQLPEIAGSAGLTTAVRSSLTTIGKNPLFKLSFVQNYGNAYSNAKNSGATEDEAQLTAIIIGLVNSGIELTGGLETLPAALKSGNASTIKKWVTSALSEGKEEVVQGVIERLTNKMVYQKDAPLASLTDPNAVFNPVTAAKEYGGGVTIGGILGGGQVLGNNIINATQKQRQMPSPEQITNETGIFDDAPATPQNAPQTILNQPTSTIAPQLSNAPQANVEAQNGIATNNASELPEGMGAAGLGFDPYSNLQNQKSQFHPDGENAFRQADVPTTDLGGLNISKTAATVMEAEVTPDAAIAKIEKAITDGDFSYMAIPDDLAKTRAQDVIKFKGWDTALRDWTADVRRGVVSKDTVALGATLYNNAVNSGNIKLAVDILVDYTANIRAGAQATQAARLLKQMTPEYQLYAIQRSVQSLQLALMNKYNDKAPNLVVDATLADNYIKALRTKDAKQISAAEKALYKNIAEQLPSTFADKWNAWRYLAMLGNPRTHIRNILGNAGFAIVRIPKNAIATSLEYTTSGAIKLINKLTGKDIQFNRTKSFMNYANDIDRARLKLGFSDYANVQEQILSAGKFDDVKSKIDRYKRAFKVNGSWGQTPNSTGVTKVTRTMADAFMTGVTAVQKANQAALDYEDTWFSAPAYARALSGYLKANGFKAEDFTNGKMTDTQIDEARAYAILEAQKATYRDFNALSDFVSRLGRGYTGDNKLAKGANLFMEGVLPFKRTPANILARGIEYSPVGAMRGIYHLLFQVRKGNVSAATAIDEISAGLTGTGLLALGIWAASAGLVKGSAPDDDKEKAIDKLQGYQNYAIQIGNKSITLDWLAPEALPFLVGAEIFAASEYEGETNLTTILNSVAKITDPLLEASMLQGLQDLINSAAYSDNGLYSILATATINYLSQGLPTLSGQIERAFEPNRQTTYIDKTTGVPGQIQSMLGKLSNKIPGWEFQQRDYIDAFGRTQSSGSVADRIINNMVNPAYVSNINKTPVDTEIARLYKSGALDTVPQQPDNFFSYNSKKYTMTQDEYDQFSKTRGQLIYKNILTLVNSKGYNNFSDEEKSAEIRSLIDYATDKAKLQLVKNRGDKYESESRFTDLTAAFNYGISIDKYYQAYFMHKSIQENEDMSASEKSNVFAYQVDAQIPGLTEIQRRTLIENLNYFQSMPTEPKRYEDFTAAGLSGNSANMLTGVLFDIKPLDGKENVSDIQRYMATVNAGLTDKETVQALSALMEEKPYQKLQTALLSGLTAKQYIDYLNHTSPMESSKDAGGKDIKGQSRKDKVLWYINSLEISRAQKDALYYAAGYKQSTIYEAPWR
jgi:hypothetical protein